MAKVKAAEEKLSKEEKMDLVKKECTIVQLDTNSDAWKAKMEKIRQDRIRKNGSDEPVPQIEIGYRTGRR